MGSDVRNQALTTMPAAAYRRKRVRPSCRPSRGIRCPPPRPALSMTDSDLKTFVEITTSDFSPAVKAMTLFRGAFFLIATTTVGRIGLAALGVAIWFILVVR
jgi:hypothetical protein